MSMARLLAPLRSEHSVNCEHFRMSKEESINLAKLVRDERQKWQLAATHFATHPGIATSTVDVAKGQHVF
jgi:hypothetical protein